MAEMSLDDAPRKARESFDKGLAAMERNNLDYAMDMFEAALELAPGLLQARRYLRAAALTKTKAGKQGGLSRFFAPLSGLGSTVQIQSQIKKNPEQAMKTAETLLRKEPLNLQYITLARDAALAAHMPEVAILSMEIAKEHYRDDIKLLENLARLYTDVDRMHDARLIYEEIVRLRPNDPKAIKQLKDSTALDTMQRGKWTDQESDFRTKLKSKSEAVSLERDAKAVKSDRDLTDLIAETRGKVQREPGNMNYKRALADLYIRAERYNEAMQVLEEARQAMGGQDPQIERMISMLRVRRLDVEIASLETAGAAADVEVKRREKDAFLLADAEERVRKYPNDLQFKYDYGVLLFEHQRITEAAQQFQLAVRNPQRRIRSLYYLALCFKNKQQYDLAKDQLEKAVSELSLMDETKKEILYELGLIAEAMGDPSKAIEYYKEIYAVDISYRDITAKIETFYGKPTDQSGAAPL